MKYIILSFYLIILTACTIPNKIKLEQRKIYFTLEEYKVYSEGKGYILGDLELLTNNKINPKIKYPYSKNIKIIKDLNFQKSNKIIEILKDKVIFKKYKNYFTPFDESSLSQIIYHRNRALVSFGYMQDKFSVAFGDFLLELKGNTIEIYEIQNAVGCSEPVAPLKN